MRWLTTETTCHTLLFTALFLLIVFATTLLACGPVDQPIPTDDTAFPAAQDTDEITNTPTTQSEGTTNTPKPTTSYPKLHSILQQLVRNYEAGTSTEHQAAAQAPLFYDRTVLITADIPANIDAVDKWMGDQNISPRHKEVTPLESRLYAYVPVSLLGALSQQTGISTVDPVVPDWIDISEWVEDSSNLQMSLPGTPTPTPDPENPVPPKFPYWMKEMLYPKFYGRALEVVYRYEEGYLTEAEAAKLAEDYQGSSILVEVILFEDSQAAEWLKSKGVSIRGEVELFGYIPVSLLKPLSDRPDVHQIIDPRRPAYIPDVPAGPKGQAREATPEPTKVSQGVNAHKANFWHTAQHKGNNVKVGILDANFNNFSNLQAKDELPATVVAQCYTTSSPSLSRADIPSCQGETSHGSNVAQAVADIAPLAELHISNPANRDQLRSSVDRMVRNGVDIIVQSTTWGLEGLGNGIPIGYNSPIESIDRAVKGGILWINSAGNENRNFFYGTASPGNGPRFYNFSTNDTANEINLAAGETTLNISLRWDDSWNFSNCDLTLYLYRGNTLVASSRRHQTGSILHFPTEHITYDVVRPGTYSVKIRISSCFRTTNRGDLSWLQLQIWEPHTLEHSWTGYSITSPGTSKNRGMLAVGAANWYNTDSVTSYSSRGPTTDNRIKPEIIAVDCAQGRDIPKVDPVTGTSNPRSRCWFAGTSQAAPHVAGLAALVMGRYPTIYRNNPEALADYLKENASQKGSPDPNNIWGHGLAELPLPLWYATLENAPPSIKVNQQLTLNISTNVPGGAKLQVDFPNDTGKISFSRNCNSDITIITRRNADSRKVALHGCKAGTVQVRLYRGNHDLLTIYTIEVQDDATLTPAPSSFTVGERSRQFTLSTTVPNPPGVIVTVTSSKLRIGGCNGTTTRSIYQSGSRITISGCSSGAAEIKIHKSLSQPPLRTYSVTVNPGSSTSLTTGTAAAIPTSFVINRNTTYTLRTTLPASTRVDVKINNAGDAGNLMFVTSTSGATGSSTCNGPANATQTVSKGGTITIRGCSAGNATVKLFKSGTSQLLETYSVAVGTETDLAALSPPTGLTLSVVADNNRNLQLDYTTVNADYRYQFELEKLEIASNTWFAQKTKGDSSPPVTFSSLNRGYLYRARGRSCSDSRRRICGVWTNWTANFELSDPQAALSGLGSSLTAGQSDNFTLTFSDLTLDQPYTVTLNTSDDGIGFNTECAQSLSSGFTPYSLSRREAKGFALYACDYPGGTMTAQLRKGNASGPVLKTVSQAVTASHEASLSPEPDKITFGDTYEYGLFTTATSTSAWPNKAGDTGKVSLTANCEETDGHVAYVGGNTVAVKACAIGRVTLRLFVADQILKTYGITIEPITASLSPEPATIQYGSSLEHLLFTNATSTAVSVKANRSGDAGNISLNSDCPGGIDSTATYVKGSAVTIKGCATGAATLSLVLSSNSTLRTYNLTVSPVYTDILTGKLMASSTFKVYRHGNTLYYHKQPCTAADLQQRFYLHIRAVQNSDLPADRRQQGFENRDFPAAGNSFRFGDQCLAIAQLPSYAMSTISTGQTRLVNNVSENTWTANFSGAAVSAPYATILSGELMADMPYKVYLKDKTLYYYKAACTQAETTNNFGLHLVPHSVSDLSSSRRTHGFDSKGFSFGGNGLRFNGSCLAAKQLPDYAIKRINTGARTGATYLWRVGFPPRTFHRPYDSIVTGTAKVSSTFNVYLNDNKLYYAKSPCTAADLEGRFRLHLTPKIRSDLPSHRQQYGFDNLDFHADRRALLAGGKCLEVIQLPSYTITRIATGQHRNGANIWNVSFATGQ